MKNMKNLLVIACFVLGFTGMLEAYETSWTLELGSAMRRDQYIGMFKHRTYHNIIYTEYGVGYWTGSDKSGIGHLSLGVFYKNFSIGIGPAYITNISSRLGSHLQFISNATVRFGDNKQWFANFSYISGLNELRALKKPDKGEAFITLGCVL